MLKLIFILCCLSVNSFAQNVILTSTEKVAEISPDSYLGYNNANLICYDKSGNSYIIYSNKNSVNILKNNLDEYNWEIIDIYKSSGIGLPTINISNDTIVWAVWTEINATGKSEIYLKYFSLNSEMQNDVFKINSDYSSIAPSVSVGNEKLYLTWCETSDNDTSVMFNTFDYKSNSFTSPVKLDIYSGKADCPGISSVGDSIFICWRQSLAGENQKIYTRVSTDGGNNWGDIILASQINEFDLIDPVISYSKNYPSGSGVIYLSYFGNNKIFLQKSYDMGNTWSSEIVVSNQGAFPRIANNDLGFVLISFEYLKTPENPNVFIDSLKDVGLSYSFNSGEQFSKDTIARTFNNEGNVCGSVYKISENEFALIWLSKLKSHNEIKLRKIKF
ncbi:MAG TPA: hypothetical protein DEP28_04210 [Bacteroidetes bacterium]|nr:hypothetical protein [Bacteroidota bacterium]HCN36377.1 hypothetical protein [Bacteroidota bacterium]